MKIVRLIAFGVLLPYLIGVLWSEREMVTQEDTEKEGTKKKRRSIVADLLFGYLTEFGIFEVLVLPAIYMKVSLTKFTIVYTAILAGLAACAVIVRRMRILEKWKEAAVILLRSSVLIWIGVICMGIQTGYVVIHQHGDDDDSFYVAQAESAVTTDTLMEIDPYTGDAYDVPPSRYVLSPFPVYQAVFSKWVGTEPVVFAHMLLPLLILPLGMGVFYLIATALFEKSEDQGIFWLIYQSVVAFSGYSIYNQSAFMMFRIWQGKAILASALLPALFYLIYEMWKEQKATDYLLLVMLMLSCCLVSSMGIMLGAIGLGIFGLVWAVTKRRILPAIGMWACCIPNMIGAVLYIIIR